MKANRYLGKPLLYAFALVMLVVQVFPIVWVIASSLKTVDQFRTDSQFALPNPIYFGNFQRIFESGNIGRYLMNTAIVAVSVVLLIVLISSTAGFAIEKMRFRINRGVMNFFLFGIMVPIQIALIPLFMMYSKIGLQDTYIGLIIPQVGFALPVSIFLFVGFFGYLPNEIMEAAAIDGCNLIRMFWRIVMPMSFNTIATIVILYGVYSWNEFIFAFTLISKRDMLTLTLGLRDYVGLYGLTDWGATFSAITLTVLPTLIIYLLFNKRIIRGMTEGAIKA